MFKGEKEAIKNVIDVAYIQGIHRTQNEKTVKSGFHESFSMLVLQGNEMKKVGVDEWLINLEEMKKENPVMWASETKYTFELVDVSGYSAVAKLDVHKGKIHFSTDYMLLYKFEEGWKIVSKIFSIPS